MALTHVDGRQAGGGAPAQPLWLGAVPLGAAAARQLTVLNTTPLPLAFQWRLSPSAAAAGDPSDSAEEKASEELPGAECSPLARTDADSGLAAGMPPAAEPRADSAGVSHAGSFSMRPAAGTLPASAAMSFAAVFEPRGARGEPTTARFCLVVGPALAREGLQGAALPALRAPTAHAPAAVQVSNQPDAEPSGQAPLAPAQAVRQPRAGAHAPLQPACGANITVELEGLALPAPQLEAEPAVLHCLVLTVGQVEFFFFPHRVAHDGGRKTLEGRAPLPDLAPTDLSSDMCHTHALLDMQSTVTVLCGCLAAHAGGRAARHGTQPGGGRGTCAVARRGRGGGRGPPRRGAGARGVPGRGRARQAPRCGAAGPAAAPGCGCRRQPHHPAFGACQQCAARMSLSYHLQYK